MEGFIKRMKDTYPISESSWSKLKQLLEVKKYPPNYKLVEIGEIPEYAYFLLKGIARSYFTSKEGKEVNSTLYSDNSYLAEFTSLIQGTQTKIEIETLTDCQLVRAKYSDFLELANTNIDINTLQIKNLESFYMTLQKHDLDLANLNSTERYLKLINEIPKIETLITQKNIALHLGISQVQLSRLKKQLYHS